MYTKDMKTKTKNQRKWNNIILYCCLALLFSVLFAGCNEEEGDDDTVVFHHSLAEQQETQETEQEAQPVEQQEYYLISGVDQIEETLQLYRYANNMEYRYYYGTGTRFYDKYGNRTTVSSFHQGLLITIGNVNSEGILCEARISDNAWVYEDVSRFSVNPQMNMLKIADTKYSYSEDTLVFSGDERREMEDIEQGDVLSVVGVDKKVLSVSITTAQGTLALTNTELFEGSFLQLGTRIFTEITENMLLQVPEGTYELIVANKGWGGSTEVTIERGKVTTVDLDTIKGSGPKNGRIQFLIDVKDAVLMIDGKEVDYEDPITLTYGRHSVAVFADDYDVWQRNLYVNSSKATIAISLKDEQDKQEDLKTGDTAEKSSQKKESESEKDSEEEKESKQSESERRQQELDTIKDLVSGLTSSMYIK